MNLKRQRSGALSKRCCLGIEGENPLHNRIERWGRTIGEAGKRKISVSELEYLQQIVIEDTRFITPGLRKEGGFVGEHDRTTGMPMTDHI